MVPDGIKEWVETGRIVHDESHVRPLPPLPASSPESRLGAAVADKLRTDKAIVGIFDEGCMGMYNAIIDDELLNGLGIYKERLSQSALYAEMLTVGEEETAAVRRWLSDRGMTFCTGKDEATELTDEQLRQQFAMYIAALRISDDYGLDAVGIQYQQGLKDLVAASDIPEGLLNNPDRPPVLSRDGSRVLWEGQALPNFNEVDEGVAVDALVTNRVWTAMGLDPSTTLHDVRWGDEFNGQFVWVFEIRARCPRPTSKAGTPGPRACASPRSTSRWAAARYGASPGRVRSSGPACTYWTGHSITTSDGAGGRAARRGDRATLAGDQLRMAHDARRARRCQPGPVHGPSQGQPCPGGVCARCRTG